MGQLVFFDAEGERLSSIQYGRMPEHRKATLKIIFRKHTEAVLQQRPELKLADSGIVEASCKTLVGQRLKRSGMSWQRNGGQGILTFLSLIKSQRFDKAWAIIATHYKQTVVEHKNVINLIVQN